MSCQFGLFSVCAEDPTRVLTPAQQVLHQLRHLLAPCGKRIELYPGLGGMIQCEFLDLIVGTSPLPSPTSLLKRGGK